MKYFAAYESNQGLNALPYNPCKLLDCSLLVLPAGERITAQTGYHTVVSAPGYMTYYLWFLAGEHRHQATADDPSLGWVSCTVPMLKELGH